MVVGSARKTVGAGRTATVKLGFGAAGRRLLRARHRLSVRLVVSQTAPGAARTVKRSTVTVKAKKRR